MTVGQRPNAVVRVEQTTTDAWPPISALCKCGHVMTFLGIRGLPVSPALPLGGERARYRCPHCLRVGWHDLPFVAETTTDDTPQGSFD